MKAKEYLSQIKRLDVLIHQRIQEKNRLRANIGIGAFDYSRPKVQKSPSGVPPFASQLERIAALEDEIDAMVAQYAKRKDHIISEIQCLPDPLHIQILYKRYVEFKRLDEIAAEMHYSYGHVKFLHARALEDFERMQVQLGEKSLPNLT